MLKANEDYFVYAAFLKPGIHQLVIYDPLKDKAFCKELLVEPSQYSDVFPEFPA